MPHGTPRGRGGAASVPTTPRMLARRGLRRHRGRVVAGTALLAGHQLSEALVPIMIGLTIDRAVVTGSVGSLLWCLLALTIVFAVLATCWRHGARCLEIATMTEAHLLRTEVADHLLGGGPIETDRATGELLSIASSDADHAAATVQWRAELVAASTGVVVATVVLLRIDGWLGLLVVLGVPLVLLALRGLAPLITRRSLAAQQASGLTTALASDLVRGLRAIRGIGATESASARYREASQETLRAQLRAAVATSAQTGAGAMLNGIVLAVVALVAGLFTSRGELTIGELVTVVGLAQFIAEPIGWMTLRIKELAVARGSAERVVEVLTATGRSRGSLAPSSAGAPPLRLDSLTYGSLHDLTIDIDPGVFVAVASEDPRDAVSLHTLLSAPGEHEGRLEVGGVDLRDVPHDVLRTTVHAEPHAIDLFEGTIGQNLFALAAPEDVADHHGLAPDAPALTASAADELVGSQPQGLAQRVVDRGVSLSGGQRQRLALARAMLADPPVLLMSEPTTAVDAVTEEQIAQGILRLRHADADRPRTTIVVTNSPALLAAADRVVFLQDGRAAGTGTHSELVASSEAYRELVLR